MSGQMKDAEETLHKLSLLPFMAPLPSHAADVGKLDSTVKRSSW